MKKSISLLSLFLSIQMMIAQKLKTVSYNDGGQKLLGMVTSNAGKKLPGVLILPAWKGIDNEAKNAALELQKQGYIAFIADIYGEGNIPAGNENAARLANTYKKDFSLYQKRISLALDELKKAGANADKIAVIGYCFGGTGALEAARGNLPVVGVVSIHGGLGKDSERPNNTIAAKVLVEHPANDRSVPQVHYDALVKELNDGKADWQIITYANTTHTFTNPEAPDYNEVMAKRAWNHTLMFLKEILK